jgi:GH15 family glucan-1,4-alpha-glucosidase
MILRFLARPLNLPPAPGLLAIIFVSTVSVPITDNAESDGMPKPWRGSAVLGNGTVCAVYSDDPRTASRTGRTGIQHFYYGDYTADYVHSTDFELLDPDGNVCEGDTARADRVGMENFFTALATSHLANGIDVESRAFAHPRDAIVLSFLVQNAPRGCSYRFWLRLPKQMVTDRKTRLEDAAKKKGEAWFEWSDGTVLAVGTISRTGRFSVGDLGVALEGDVDEDPVTVVIAAAASEKRAREKLSRIRRERSPSQTAATHWESWIRKSVVPERVGPDLCEAYRRNLYAVRSACLNGRIPADLTGQFLTHNMPQLYPRDALMCARVLMMTGHLEEAREVLVFWGDSRIPMKSRGEWYARYDAHGQAVDAGSGARYDEPEWDSNGYFIQLADAYHGQTGDWPVDTDFILRLADFLVEHIDNRGLLFEGGIVEWSGYLPATNMTAAAALMTASRIAKDLGDSHREDGYRSASERISMSLGLMFDQRKKTYADVRYAEGKDTRDHYLGKTGKPLYFWDTSTNFGALWGYPDHLQLKQSNAYYEKHCVQLGGGVQYYDARESGLAGYGHDVFSFNTAAAAQYHARFGDPERARVHIEWMEEYANVYGLMPERIFLSGKECSAASPLMWSCAEFCAAVIEYDRTKD